MAKKNKVEKVENFKWCYTDNNKLIQVTNVVERLNAGFYTVSETQSGLEFEQIQLKTDQLIDSNQSDAHDILNRIKEFWKNKNVYHELGYLWKFGILMYGPPGSGKTSYINLIANEVIANDTVVILSTKYVDDTINAVKIIRTTEPDRPIMVVLEDVDGIIDYFGDRDLLSLLDGEAKVDNIVYVATTNHIEKLPPRIKNRKNRFDIVKYIGFPNESLRREYFKTILPDISIDKLEEWVNLTNTFSLPEVKDFITSVVIFNQDPVETSKEILDFKKTIKDAEEKDDDDEEEIDDTSEDVAIG